VRDLDLIVVRELIGDVYFGAPRHIGKGEDGQRLAVNTMCYREDEILRIAHVAFRKARRRHRRLCSIDKANVLEISELWRAVVCEVGRLYPDVELVHMYVDDAAMALVRNPSQFDVIVTSNMFGDILSDEAVMLTGSMGVLPSASFGDGSLGLYEPVHGAASHLAGKDSANPLGAILSMAMLLRHSLGLEQAAERVERAVRSVLTKGYRTPDIAAPNGHRIVGTQQMGAAVAEMI